MIKYVSSIFISIKRKNPLLRTYIVCSEASGLDTRFDFIDLLGIRTRPGSSPQEKAQQKRDMFT